MYVCSHERIEANNYTRVVQRIFHKYKKKLLYLSLIWRIIYIIKEAALSVLFLFPE
jgi:hypothetical protein